MREKGIGRPGSGVRGWVEPVRTRVPKINENLLRQLAAGVRSGWVYRTTSDRDVVAVPSGRNATTPYRCEKKIRALVELGYVAPPSSGHGHYTLTPEGAEWLDAGRPAPEVTIRMKETQ